MVYFGVVKTITSTEAKTRLNAVLAEVQRTGEPVTITTHGHPVAVLSPVQPRQRTFGQFPSLVVPETFDEPLPVDELSAWEPTT
jgi:prevent-host-death family protein